MDQRLTQVIAQYGKLDEASFLGRCRHGFLVLVDIGDSDRVDAFQTMMGGAFHDAADPLSQDPRVLALLKLGELQPYAKITIGRTPNNDIVLLSPAISKFHGYFRVTRGLTYELVDAGSTNGTLVNGQPLEPNAPCPLTGEETLTFGGAFEGTYRTPASMWQYMELMTRLHPR